MPKKRPTPAKTKQAKRSKAKTKPPAPPPAARRPKRQQTRSIDKRGAFLAAYAVCASINRAAEAARIDRSQHYQWMREDPAYAARFHLAKEQAAQALEDEATERAMVGVYEPNIFQGRFIYPQEEVITPAVIGPRGGVLEPERREWRDVPGAQPLGVWKKSDSLMALLLRGALPEKYGFRGAMEVTGAAGGPIEIVERLNRARARAAQRAAAE